MAKCAQRVCHDTLPWLISVSLDDALLTVRHFSERPNSPAYFRFLEAKCWAEKQNWERAWNAWQAFQAAQATR
jgi:hypothetical protein